MTEQQDPSETLVTLDIKDVIPTPDMPRKPMDNDPKLKAMVESILRIGQQEPVIVRLHPDLKGKFDLRDGGRRLRACQLAGLSTIKAILKPMDDKLARECTMISFLHREDLSPLQEAKGIAMLLGDGKEEEAIASDIGRSLSFVRRRRQLMNLSPAVLGAYGDPNGIIGGWSCAHLELIARFEPTVQDRILRSMAGEYRVCDWTLNDLEDHLADFLHVLKLAPWDLKDSALVKAAGACVACHKRSECNPWLFEEAAGRKAGSADDKCLDAECWKKKDAAWMVRRITLLREKQPDLVMIERAGGVGKSTSKALKHWQFQDAKQNVKGAIPAVVVKGNDRGELIWIKVSQDVEPAAQASAKPKTLKELRAELERKRFVAMADAFEDALFSVKTPAKLSEIDLLAWLVVGSRSGGGDVKEALKMQKTGRSKIIAAATQELLNLYRGCVQTVDDAEVMSKVFGIKLQPFIDAAVKAHPEPAEWANLKADGTPKA